MSEELRFDGKVVVITGAGNGLGRSHALLFGGRGAKVVVNDLGGDAHGGGKGSAAADKVVEEIKALGGEAVANYSSVEDGAKIIETAVEAFGRVDVVINNAGILRDKSFPKMTEEDWDLIYRVHLLGSYRVSHAAWSIMREQGYGRIVMTSSAAGIYGNFGQANYSAAKLALVGLANTLAVEGRKKNVLVNTIAPIAGSRMTETVLPKELLAALKPEVVSPLVAYLCHESCEETGGLFEVGGGFFAKLRWERSAGHTFRLGRAVTPEQVRDEWSKIAGFESATHPADIASSMQPVMENVERGPGKGGNKLIDVDRALGYEFPEESSSYDERDLALYALGVGAGRDPGDEKDLRLVYEMNGGGFYALPTYGVIPAVNLMLSMGKRGMQAPGLHYGLDRILHGEQYTELTRPLPPKAKLTHRVRIKDIFDKGKGALVVTETKSYDEDGDLLILNETTTFVRGAGGWGGDRGPSSPGNESPERAPDAVAEESIGQSQALLYRLSGDWNPLHVDPGFAKAFGFEKPILHGLCTFGYAGRHVINAFCKGDPRYFKSIQVRFAKSVFPGDTVVTEMWKESDTKILFRTSVKEREEVVLSHGAIELYAEIPKKKAKKPAASAAASASAAPAEPNSADIFGGIASYVADHPELAQKIGVVYQFKLSDPASVWTVDLSGEGGSVAAGEAKAPGCTLEMTDGDFMDMCTGKANAQKLYFGGKLKISGDLMASQKLTFLSKVEPERVQAAMKARLGAAGGGGGGGGEAAAPAAPAAPNSADIFGGIGSYLADHPELAQKIGTTYQFKLSEPDSVWTVSLKGDKGTVSAGQSAVPDCTLEMTDGDFMDMCTGKANAQKLYFGGKLKISGDLLASQKLTFLSKVEPERVQAAMKARLEGGGAGAAAAAAAAASTPATAATAPALFAKLKERLASAPELIDEVKAVVRFVITAPDARYTVSMLEAPGGVEEGEAGEPSATITIADADLAALSSGAVSAKELFQKGRMKVEGDIGVAHRLGFLKGLA